MSQVHMAMAKPEAGHLALHPKCYFLDILRHLEGQKSTSIVGSQTHAGKKELLLVTGKS